MLATTSKPTQYVMETCSLRFVRVEAPDHGSALLAAQLLACRRHRANFCANSVRFDDASDSFFEYLGDLFRTRKLEG